MGSDTKATDLTSVVWLARIYRESIARMDVYDQRLSEGKDAEAALEFGAYILWSGLTALCQEMQRQEPPINGTVLRYRAEELQRAARARLKKPMAMHPFQRSQLEAINRKLDLIAGHVSRFH